MAAVEKARVAVVKAAAMGVVAEPAERQQAVLVEMLVAEATAAATAAAATGVGMATAVMVVGSVGVRAAATAEAVMAVAG